MSIQPIKWLGDSVIILDQTKLPQKEAYIETSDYRVVAAAIKKLQVRGAPSIGVAGAYGIALGALGINTDSKTDFLKKFQKVSKTIASTRPTARNLFYAVERMEKVAQSGKSVANTKARLVKEAIKINEWEAEATVKMSKFGASLIKDGFTILTHCNAGPLATTGYGTALGVIIRAHEQGKKIKVFADETRPLLQGARLTVWELQKAGIPVTLITDNMAGYFMSQGKIDCVIVGADRIAANGDTANKIGTYSVAVLAKENGVPFYVAAPTTTFDTSLKTGAEIPIEERKAEEVTHIRGVPIAPNSTQVNNPAFDVTPHKYIAALITERGIIKKPFGVGMKKGGITKYVQTRDDLLGHLKNQIAFIKQSSISFDKGFDGEAQRLALAIRVLVHDSKKSKSLLTQLDRKDIEFYDSAQTHNLVLGAESHSGEGVSYLDNLRSDQPRDLQPYSGLTIIQMSAKEASHIAPLDSTSGPMKNIATKKPFSEWWGGMFVIRDGDGRTYTRKDLILETANTDGGAHIDPRLNGAYANLSRFNSLGWRFVKNNVPNNFKNSPVLPSIRQIAQEVLRTLEEEFPELL